MQNQISPALMEALQMLKFLLKKKHLDFMASWKTPDVAMLGETRLEAESQLGIMLDSLMGGHQKAFRPAWKIGVLNCCCNSAGRVPAIQHLSLNSTTTHTNRDPTNEWRELSNGTRTHRSQNWSNNWSVIQTTDVSIRDTPQKAENKEGLRKRSNIRIGSLNINGL
ncbi:hypothetical protein EI94DRAFT_1704091 [Lactarius quietus]|nr:hypothetical protein EI94DRAFT_1704091 [Lactarius quietus]